MLCTGDDKTFKRIIDIGFFQMIKLKFASGPDKKILLEIILFLMRFVIHSRDTNDVYVKAVIEELIYKHDEVKNLLENYYNDCLNSKDQEVELEE